MKKFLYSFIGIGLAAIAATGCADNINDIYEPVETAKTVGLTPITGNGGVGSYNEKVKELTISAAPSIPRIAVKSNTRWILQLNYKGTQGWITLSANSGSGNDTIDLHTLENFGENPRECAVTISAVDSLGTVITGKDGVSDSFTLIQKNSNVRLVPSDVKPFEAENPVAETFNILADEDIEWSLFVSYEETEATLQSKFIEISMSDDDKIVDTDTIKGKGDSSFVLRLKPNGTAANRIGYLNLESKIGSYSIEIQQLGTEYIFDVSYDDGSSIGYQGGAILFGVYSPQIDWKIEGAPSWIKFDPETGKASPERTQVKAIVEPFPDKTGRTATVKFIPVGTDSALYTPYNVIITQGRVDTTFKVSADNGTSVDASGGNVLFTVYSPVVGWKVEGLPSNGWLSVNPQAGDASDETISVVATAQPNTSNQERPAYLTFVPVGENASLYEPVEFTVTQPGIEYTFDVSGDNNPVVSEYGGNVDFGVFSPQLGWRIEGLSADDSWINFNKKSGDANNTRETITATLSPNISNKERVINLTFAPVGSHSESYPKHSVKIVQNGFNLPFNASPNGALDIVDIMGGSKTIELNSSFNWEIQGLPDWIDASALSGDALSSSQRISISIKQNTLGDSRNCALLIRPLTTTFKDFKGNDFEINPYSLGVSDIQVSITQYGVGKEPAISVPWLAEGYSQTAATVEFNFYSPFYDIKGAGVQWKPYVDNDTSNDNWITVEDSDFKNSGADGYVSVELSNLKAATKYVARGYVVYANGKVKYGEVSYPFTTAGIRPGGGDNPTPHN